MRARSGVGGLFSLLSENYGGADEKPTNELTGTTPMGERNDHLVPFTIKGTPGAYYQRVIALATVMPLMGPSRGPTAVAESALLLVDRWRARVAHLSAAGWDLTRAHAARRGDPREVQGRAYRMLNCRPAAFEPSPVTPSCCVASICPHCWGRQAADQWRAIDGRLFEGGRKKLAATLVRRTLRYAIRFELKGGLAALPQWFSCRLACERSAARRSVMGLASRRTNHRLLAAAGCAGGFEQVAVELRPATEKVEAHWSIAVRQLLLVPERKVRAFRDDPWVAQAEASCEGDKTGVRTKLSVHRRPTRRLLVYAVAAACRYPKFQLYGDAARTLEVLEARRGHRLSTRFGSLHGGAGPTRDRS
jgi:hypothetical protein